ncbi:MAG: hypothetical protein N5P05_001511 [Chroococcopsis gigantea SAG 12.99]|jgi:hypothetical protein|nr:zinc ribbon domain-containing protein [Chlorogloea purpurea SAG 13.99]MDV2999905.1 hypothetical protein [Chroococcopsis gigantea SAG 12.99]
MAFQCDLGNGQSIYLHNQGDKTVITLCSSNQGQQQRSSSSFITGGWQGTPQIDRVNDAIRVKIPTATQEYVFSIVHNSITSLTDNEPAQPETIPLSPLQNMPPMPPMKMGDMSMNLGSMTMTMGNMSMSMGEKYCSQCGAKVNTNAKFCSECGHKLG